MLANATVNSWKRITGTTGAGHPSRAALTLAHKIPCELVTPSAARRASERAAGIELSRVVLLEAAVLAAISGLGDPTVGDQITVALIRRPDVSETLDIVELREHPGEAGSAWEIKCGARLGGVTA